MHFVYHFFHSVVIKDVRDYLWLIIIWIYTHKSEIEGLFMSHYYMDLYTQSEIEGLFMAHYYIDFLYTV